VRGRKKRDASGDGVEDVARDVRCVVAVTFGDHEPFGWECD